MFSVVFRFRLSFFVFIRQKLDKGVGDRMDVIRRYDAGEFGVFEQPIGQEINRSMNADCAPDPIEGRT